VTRRSENVRVILGEFDGASVWIPDAAVNNGFAAIGQRGQAGEAND
jgi:hypothetical protein